MPGAVFIATMHQPTHIATSGATSTPLTTTEAMVLFSIMTILVIIIGWAFMAAMRAQDLEIAEKYGTKPKRPARPDAAVDATIPRDGLFQATTGVLGTGRNIPFTMRPTYDITPVEISTGKRPRTPHARSGAL